MGNRGERRERGNGGERGEGEREKGRRELACCAAKISGGPAGPAEIAFEDNRSFKIALVQMF